MKFQPLSPWVKGNRSVTPSNFYYNDKPCLELGLFISLDVATDLYLVNSIDSGNLHDSWNANKEYIEKACKIANIDISNNDFDLDHEEKEWILEELGEPPFCCYNLYFVTIYNDKKEKIVYIGKTDSKKSRFADGHAVALKLHNPKYNKYNKRVYFGTLTFISKEKEYMPLEFITPYNEAEKYLNEVEALLISWFNPELNIKLEDMGQMKHAHVHIQNFSDVSVFLHDYMIDGF